MENTSALLFDNKHARYFLATGGKAVGPLTAQDLYERISRNECQLLSYVWMESWSDWRPIAEVEEFRALIPAKPDRSTIKKIQEKLAARKKPQQAAPMAPGLGGEKRWYLFFNGAQFGPFAELELIQSLDVQKVDGSAFVWTPGWAQWKPVGDVAPFSSHISKDAPPAPPPVARTERKTKTITKAPQREREAERRQSPRRPLIAKLFLHNDKEVIVAVCRDISVGGMQVLTDHVPGTVGTVLKLNVSPSGAESVKGFVAEGEIVRVLEDGRGFSFRFKKISPEARKAIEAYIRGQ